jgi:hypothetical protein
MGGSLPAFQPARNDPPVFMRCGRTEADFIALHEVNGSIFMVRHDRKALSRSVSRLGFLAFIVGALLGICAAPAPAADLYLVDEKEIYIALDKLNAMGLLPDFLANTRPYDMQAVRAALDNAARLPPGEVGGADFFSRWVEYYSNATAMARGTAALSYAQRGTVPPNNGGVPVPEGFSAEFSALGRYEPLPYLSGNAKGVAWFGENGNNDALLAESSLAFGHKYISLVAGKLTTWYGPGRHGSLIFTNNAEPYPGVRLHNPVPIPMPWIFSFLGNLQYDLFVAQLDGNRPIPDSRLSGFRLAVKPSRYFEIGVSRAIHFGGEGQSNSLYAWWDAFLATDINKKPGVVENELAGFDVELTLPFRVQPVQLYFEMAGEDQHGATSSTPFPTPEKWAYLGGVFLPAILGSASFDLRFEYATNHVDDNGPTWYVHPSYPHEYKGQVLGHPMGNDARDIWLQGHWFILPSTYLEFSWDRTDRYSPGPATETTESFQLAFLGWFTRSIRARAGMQTATVTNAGGVPGQRETDFTSRVDLSWQFSGGK